MWSGPGPAGEAEGRLVHQLEALEGLGEGVGGAEDKRADAVPGARDAFGNDEPGDRDGDATPRLCAQLAQAALASGRVVIFVCNEPAPFLLQQTSTLGFDLGLYVQSRKVPREHKGGRGQCPREHGR